MVYTCTYQVLTATSGSAGFLVVATGVAGRANVHLGCGARVARPQTPVKRPKPFAGCTSGRLVGLPGQNILRRAVAADARCLSRGEMKPAREHEFILSTAPAADGMIPEVTVALIRSARCSSFRFLLLVCCYLFLSHALPAQSVPRLPDTGAGQSAAVYHACLSIYTHPVLMANGAAIGDDSF